MPLPKFLQALRNIHGQTPVESPLAIIAPDKFKGTLTAAEATKEIRSAVTEIIPDAQVLECPMADGGEGTAEIIARHLGLTECTIAGHDALMNETCIRFFSDSETCAVDCASIVGLAMLGQTPLQPWQSTSFGVGEFLCAMLKRGMKKIFIGIGGTASIDGGAGLLQALGAKFFDVEGEQIKARPIRAHHLSTIYSVDFSAIPRQPLKQHVIALADVDLPLIPPSPGEMSSLSFAIQKGIYPHEMPKLHKALENFNTAVDNALYAPAEPPRFQGAGGGIGYALHRVLHCNCEAGAEFITSVYELPSILGNASPATRFILTGEGSFDAQSFQGKATGTILQIAKQHNTPVIVIAGKTEHPSDNTEITSGIRIISTSEYQPPNSDINHNTALAALKTALHNKLPLILQKISTHTKNR